MHAQIITLHPQPHKTKRLSILTGWQAGAREPQRQTRGFRQFEYGCSRLCRHVVSGRTQAPKICTRNHECYHCAFDQMLDEYDGTGHVDGSSGLIERLNKTA